MDDQQINQSRPSGLQEGGFARELRNVQKLLHKEASLPLEVAQALKKVNDLLDKNPLLLSGENKEDFQFMLKTVNAKYPKLLSDQTKETMSKVNKLWLKMNHQLFQKMDKSEANDFLKLLGGKGDAPLITALKFDNSTKEKYTKELKQGIHSLSGVD